MRKISSTNVAVTSRVAFALVAVLASGMTFAQETSVPEDDDRPVLGLQSDAPIRVVYHVSHDEWQDGVSKPLFYLKKLRGFYAKAGYRPEQLDIHAVFHGSASSHLLTDKAWSEHRSDHESDVNPSTGLIHELKQAGVHVELCDSRRREEGWSKSEIHPEVQLVEAAFPRLIDLQNRGYAYIRF